VPTAKCGFSSVGDCHHRTFSGPPPPRFVAGVLTGTLALLGCVGAFSALVDPYGFVGSAVFPTAILSDRATKACLAERLPVGPQLVVYGLLSEGQGEPIEDWLQEDIPVQPPGDRTFQVEGTASFSCARFTILGAGHDRAPARAGRTPKAGSHPHRSMPSRNCSEVGSGRTMPRHQ